MTTVNVKDFVIDIPKVKEEIEKKKESKQTPKPIYEAILQNDTDFVIHRKTSTTDKNFVFLISQEMFYIQNNKTKDVDVLTKENIRVFFQLLPYKFKLLTEVGWWDNDRIDNMVELMSFIISNPTMQKAYKYGIFIQKHQIKNIESGIEKNIKLLKYCYEKKDKLSDYFDQVLKLAIEIENRVNFNNAKYFVDKFCESSMKITFYERYINGKKTIYDELFYTISTYNLDFNRFIDYISFDLYTQGIDNFNYNIYKIYNDYLKMQISLYGKIKEKYPKHLKTEYDIVALKTRVYKQHKKELMLLNVVDNFKGLEFKDKDYCIILPQSTVDIVEEGVNMSSCVASYVDRVANNQSLIVFMRKVEELDVSLVTVEIDHSCIVQAAGFANRKITNEEAEFLKKWAKEKELHYKI